MSDWHSRTLQEIISTIESGTRPKGGVRIGENSEGVPSYGGENISMNGGMLYDSVRMVPTSFATEMRRGVLSDKDVLINKDGANTGKSAIYRKPAGEKFATINEHLFLLRCNQGIAEQEFLYHFLNSEFGKSQIAKVITGSAQPGLNSTFPEFVRIDLPPLPEQKKIAEILSGIDNAISIKKQARIDLEATREAICKELIQNRDWNEEKVGGLTTHMTNGFVGTATPHYRERGIRYLTSKNIRRDRIDPRKMIYISEEFHKANQKSSLSVGDVLMVQSGHIGTTAVVTDEYKDCNCHALILMRFNQEQLDPHYASLYFNSTTGRTRLSDIFVGSTVKHVNTGDLRKFKIPLPPLGVQKEIANRVNAIDRLLGQRGVQIEKLVILKQAISSDLLSGRKRVSI